LERLGHPATLEVSRIEPSRPSQTGQASIASVGHHIDHRHTSKMTPRREPSLTRTQLRMGLIGVGAGVLLTTDLNGFAGILMGLVLIILYGGQALWAFLKRRRGEKS
jgi:hypothetical protein